MTQMPPRCRAAPASVSRFRLHRIALHRRAGPRDLADLARGAFSGLGRAGGPAGFGEDIFKFHLKMCVPPALPQTFPGAPRRSRSRGARAARSGPGVSRSRAPTGPRCCVCDGVNVCIVLS